MKFRNLLAMLPVLAAYSCTFDEGGLPGGRRPNLHNEGADGFVNSGNDSRTKDAENPKSRDAELDGKIIRKDGNIDSMVMREDAGRDLGTDSFARDSGVDAPYFHDAGVPDLGRDLSLARDMGRDLGEDVYRPDMGRDGFVIFPDIIIRPFDLGSDARDGSLDLGRDGLTRDLGLDGIVADAGRDLGPGGPVLPRPYECDANTVALYHFDQPDQFLDSCGAHNLTNSGTTESVGQPGFGEARNVAGIQDYLNASNSIDMNFGDTNDFTIEVWFRTVNIPDETDTLIGKLPSIAPTSGYGIIYSAGRGFTESGWMCVFYESSFNSYVASGSILRERGIDETLADGEWHHIACTRSNNGANASIYIDSEQIMTRSITPRNVSNNNLADFTVGTTINGIAGDTQDFNGEIDEVRISNIARTP